MSRHKFNAECETCQEKRAENKRIAALEAENKELREALANAYERAAQVAETYESKHTLSTEMLRFDRNPTTLVDGIVKEIRALAAGK